MTAPHLVRAAGCLVWRPGKREPQVLLVHRPRWADWSFPKGKLDEDEPAVAAAIREVREETGLAVRLGPRLADHHYPVGNGQPRPKVVSYWAARAPRDADITTYEVNDEIDALAWMTVTEARSRLTYPRDVEMLDELLSSGFDSTPLLVVRHAHALSRSSWSEDDSERPLRASGHDEAKRLVPVFDAYGVRRVVSSDALRCVDTVLPYVNTYDVRLDLDPALSEVDTKPSRLRKVVDAALHSEKRTALCTHRPVLPAIFDQLGVPDTVLPPGGIVVVHRTNGKVVGVEQYGGPDV